MDARRIPADMAAAIEESWPHGVIEEFDADESYFHDIHGKLERDLRKIPGASVMWQTKPEDDSTHWDDDDDDEPPPFRPDFQSYHIFFLSPQDAEFEFESETETLEEPEDPEDPDCEPVSVTCPGRGRFGCSALVSLANPFAAVTFCEYDQYEDGSCSTPDPGNFTYFHDETGEQVEPDAHYRGILGDSGFTKLEKLRERIAKVLAKHGVAVLDRAILDLPVPHL